MKQPITIRGHHIDILDTIAHYPDEWRERLLRNGYTAGDLEKDRKVLEALSSDPGMPVILTNAPDAICKGCSKSGTAYCNEVKTSQRDDEELTDHRLKPGMVLTARQLSDISGIHHKFGGCFASRKALLEYYKREGIPCDWVY